MKQYKFFITLALLSFISLSSCNNSNSGGDGDSFIPPVDNYEVIETFSKRMPGEFEPVSMVKMCYPNNVPLSVFKTIAENVKLLVLVNPDDRGNSRISEARQALQGIGARIGNIEFLDMEMDEDREYWIRDFSPFYVFDNLDLSIVDFTYNRPARVEQNSVPVKLSFYFGMNFSNMKLVHTGGNLMQDGRGTAFSDDLVVSENKNDKAKVVSQMKEYTGTDNYVITIDPQGDYIAHIDCWSKIIAPDKIVVARLPKSNPRYQYYEQVAEELGNLKCAYGYNYKIYRVDEPGGGTIAPYTNALIANDFVYMPLGEDETYNENALEVYREALPGYTVIGVEGYPFDDYWRFLNTDALHCRTHEVPDKNMIFIDSREVFNGKVALQDEYLIKANVVAYSKEEIDFVKIHYSINGSPYVEENMSKYKETTNYTYVFKGLNSGDDVKYYIEARDKGSNNNVDPTCKDRDPHQFNIE